MRRKPQGIDFDKEAAQNGEDWKRSSAYGRSDR